VFAEACSEIAAKFTDRGFRFAQSGPHARKKAGDFTYQIGFQSSHKNAAGVTVKLWIHGTVFSKKLESWRRSYPELYAMDYVAGGQIGNLSENTIWHDWDLADIQTRASIIHSAIATVESVAMPYFGQFDDVDSMIRKVQKTDIPSMTIDRVIEFLMCFGNRQAAWTAACQFLARHPHLVGNYQRDYARYAERGFQYRNRSGSAAQLAFASHLFQFGDLTNQDA
jgi:hypothetical protein